MKDSDIVGLFFSRDRHALDETQARYGAYCFTVANNILESAPDAEECVNDMLLAAWNSIPPVRPQNLRLYLAKLVRNAAVNRYNRRLAEKRGGGETALVLEELSECIPGREDPLLRIEAKELGKAISAFVETLPKREGAILIRRCFFAEPIASIAKRFLISENNASVILSRTRAKLRAYLEKEGYFHEK